jgi:GNAT superfamily N-acetyltransferase
LTSITTTSITAPAATTAIADRARKATLSPTTCTSARLVLRAGTRADYDQLSVFHYRAGPPATFARVMAMHDPVEGSLAAVLVVSYPTLRGPWRAIAWPGRYDPHAIRRASPAMTRVQACREALTRLNREVRCLSRVVVEPRWRGLGVAHRLVSAYLATPMTPRTEAIAAMAAASPFFQRAGMTPLPIAPTPSDDRLRDALDRARAKPIDLLDPTRWRVLTRRNRWLIDEVHRWAQLRPSMRALAQGPDASDAMLASWAGLALVATPVAYVAEHA